MGQFLKPSTFSRKQGTQRQLFPTPLTIGFRSIDENEITIRPTCTVAVRVYLQSLQVLIKSALGGAKQSRTSRHLDKYQLSIED